MDCLRCNAYKGILCESTQYQVLMLLSCVEARFDGNSEIVAELVTSNGFKAAYAIKDGAEGSRGWVVSAHIVFLLHLLDTTLCCN